VIVIFNTPTVSGNRRPRSESRFRNGCRIFSGISLMLTSCFRMAPSMAVADRSWWARKSQYSQAIARSFSSAWSHRLSITRELISSTCQRQLPFSPPPGAECPHVKYVFPTRDPQNKIAPAQGIYPLRYSVFETRWFPETNLPRHRACQLAHLGAAAEVLEVIATSGFDYPHPIPLC